MTDNFDNNDFYSDNVNTSSENNENVQNTSEASYEWNNQGETSNEYHHSYVNGNNADASHNPNRYETFKNYSNQKHDSVEANPYQKNQDTGYSNNSSSADRPNYNYSYNSNNYNNNTAYNGLEQKQSSNSSNYASNAQANYSYKNSSANTPNSKKIRSVKVNSNKSPASKGFVVAMLIVSILLSSTVGFFGGMIANSFNGQSSSININKSSATASSSKGMISASGTTTEIVKKTADSVVEIATESKVTGAFYQEYVQQGAGSGVIISDDGYIITNYHVIDGAKSITVSLRDVSTSYKAELIGSDEDNDIALLKINANGLSPATFGDSNNIAVGDYVVAIGNPLGTLGGTVTDGIISALAREVTIDNESMTLLQHNAQISPGNSGGGLFNSNGELIGIVNAKTSSTEVEGIAFAIPINNVIDIIDDLKTYGYVKGKVDLGMKLTDISSNDKAFYYGLSKTGCYVLSVSSGSNADKAGFKKGDLITKVDNSVVSNSDDIKKALKDSKVGDTAKFTVYRAGSEITISLTLEEYTPSNASNETDEKEDSNYSIWDYMFGW